MGAPREVRFFELSEELFWHGGSRLPPGIQNRRCRATSVASEIGRRMDIQKTVEELSEALVFVDRTDLQTLAGMHTRFEKVAEWAEERALDRIVQASARASTLIEGIILEECDDPEGGIKLIGRIVTAFQEIVFGGRDANEVEFPPELNLPGGKPTAGGSDTSPELPGTAASGPAGVSLPVHVDDKLFADFLARQMSAMDELEALILIIESGDDPGSQAALRGIIHTLKGEAGVVGLHDVERVCHTVEDLLDGELPPQMADTLLTVKDWLSQVLSHCAGVGPEAGPAEQVLEHLAPLTTIQPAPSDVPPEPAPAAEAVESVRDAPSTEPVPEAGEIDFGLLADFIAEARDHLENADTQLLTLETDPKHDEALNSVFRAFHTIKGVAGFMELHDIGSLAHEAESLLDQCRKGDMVLVGLAIDVIFEAVDAMKRLFDDLTASLASGKLPAADPALPPILERIRFVAAGELAEPQEIENPVVDAPSERTSAPTGPAAITEEEIQRARSGANQPSQPVQSAVQPAAEPAKPQPAPVSKPAAQQQRPIRVRESVKVDAERLDRLVETIGELVIAESMVSKSAEDEGHRNPDLARHMKQLGKITRELQEMGTSLRMVPVRSTFQKMARLVRDLSRKTGKPLDFVMAGEETELDKTVVDRLGDPLVHMLRNAVDHGLEAGTGDRTRAGKPERGRIELRAFHKGGNIYIEIEDDGRGLNRDAILRKARERNLIGNDHNMSDRDVFSLIFEPGFSTAESVTDVSGRGVGMDVVKRNIVALRGQVDIQSELGTGSTFSIRLPLTLAIIDGMVVRIGRHRYIIPTLSVVQSIMPGEHDIGTVLNQGEMLATHGRHVPLFRLAELFGIDDAQTDLLKSLVVIVEDGENQAGLIVDDLVGQQQIVIKSLGEYLRGFTSGVGISGGAIMSDGRVGLILDVGGLVRLAN